MKVVIGPDQDYFSFLRRFHIVLFLCVRTKQCCGAASRFFAAPALGKNCGAVPAPTYITVYQDNFF
jgi:hypothetical protein